MKYENDHLRAQALVAALLIESLAENDSRWLSAHLRECPACEGMLSAQRDAIRVMKTIPARTPAFLAARTKARVHSRRHELDESRRRMQLLAISCVLALVSTIALVPVIWQLLKWAGGADLLNATVVWSVVIAWFWGAPALAGAALVMSHRDGQHSLFRSALMRRMGHE